MILKLHVVFSRCLRYLPMYGAFAVLLGLCLFAVSDTYARPPTSVPTSKATLPKPIHPMSKETLPKPVHPSDSKRHTIQFKHGDWLPELPPDSPIPSPDPRPSSPTSRPDRRFSMPSVPLPVRPSPTQRDVRKDRWGRPNRIRRRGWRRLDPAQESDERILQRYRIDLVTIGPGNWLFTYFGHNALRVRDRLLGHDMTYNFGTFSGNNPVKLLRDYLRNQMQYWLSVIPHNYLLRGYQYTDRTFQFRTLHLRAKEIRRLLHFLRHHARPENRFYRYDHYRQNCSTKLRDALHYAMGPVFREDALTLSPNTYRKHVMQRTTPNPVLMILMDFGMGPFADRPLRRWDDMFLPVYLESYVADSKWMVSRGRLLASPASTLYQRKAGEAMRIEPAPLAYGMGGFWFLLGLLLWARPAFRRWLRLYLFVAASLGTALAAMMFFTWMPEPPRNANLLMYHPLHWLPFLLLAKKRWEVPSTRRILGLYLITHAWLGMLYLIVKPIIRLPIQMNTHHYVVAIALFGLAAFRFYYGPAPASSSSPLSE